MKRFISVLLGLLSFLVSTGTGQAQTSSLFESEYKEQVTRENAKLTKDLKLSPKQIQAIGKIRSKYTPQVIAVSRKFAPVVNKITTDLKGKKINKAAADSRQRKIALQVHAELDPIRARQQQEIEAVLTPEQRARWQASRNRRSEQARKLGMLKK